MSLINIPVIIAVAIGGAVGSVARLLIGAAYAERSVGFPWATLGINILGATLLGLLAGWLVARPDGLPTVVAAGLMIGLLGGFTTFSTITLEVMYLAGFEEVGPSSIGLAVLYPLLTCVAGISAAIGGWHVGRVLGAG